MSIMNTREYKFDNIRFILILLVVMGHLLENAAGFGDNSLLYRVIYLFHMPAFMFLSGYFARFNKRKICNLIFTYIIFQIIYCTYDFFFINYDPCIILRFQFTTPYWLLWYILVLIFYYLLIPILDSDNKSTRFTIFITATIFSLLAGFDHTIGLYLSLSRLLTFFPYFILGYYMKREGAFTFSRPKHLLALLGIILSILFLWKNPQITAYVLYGSYSYHGANYNICTKLILMLLAYVYIYFLFHLPNINRKIPVITSLGQNTLSIFLLHGFIIKALEKTDYLSLYPKYNLLIVILLTIIILILLGNTFVANRFSKLFMRKWKLFSENQAINKKMDG